jgi:hypothetical protein
MSTRLSKTVLSQANPACIMAAKLLLHWKIMALIMGRTTSEDTTEGSVSRSPYGTQAFDRGTSGISPTVGVTLLHVEFESFFNASFFNTLEVSTNASPPSTVWELLSPAQGSGT